MKNSEDIGIQGKGNVPLGLLLLM